MELKAVGKIGMVKRKQFLQKRDISRSHEVNQFIHFIEVHNTRVCVCFSLLLIKMLIIY